MGLSHHVWFLDAKQRLLDRNNKSLSPRHDLSFCACKTAWLAPESLVSMCPSPHLWFLHAKQRILDQNFKSLLIPDQICDFVHQNSVICSRITSLSGSQTSPVDLSMQNSVISTRIASLYGFQPSSVFYFAFKTATLWPKYACVYGTQTSPVVFFIQNSVPIIRISILYGPQPSSVVFACKTASFGLELQVSMNSRPLSFCAWKTSWFAPEWQVYMGSSPHLSFSACKTAR